MNTINVEGVLIVGAGAVGLTTALSLAMQGVPVTVLEAEPISTREFRGSTFHPPTLEMLDELGVGTKLIAKGVKARKIQFRDRIEGIIAEFDLGCLKKYTRYPFRLQIDQYALVELLLDKLKQIPDVQILFGQKVTGVIQNKSKKRVIVTAQATDGAASKFAARYVVGADGSRSKVRRSMNLDFAGITYPNRYLTLFTKFDFATHLPGFASVNYISDAREWAIMLKSPDVWRVLFPIPPDEPDSSALKSESIENRLQGILAIDDRYPIVLSRIYKVHQRVAETYRLGNVLLAGDAAHVNNPVGGMGLNGGIHDAIILSSKLALIWHGLAGDTVLDKYAITRRKVAINHVKAQSHENALAIGEGGPKAREHHKARLSKIATNPEETVRYLLRTSMITNGESC